MQRLRELLDGAADPNAVNSYGRTPIQVGRLTVGSWARAAALRALPEAGGGKPRRSSGPSGAPDAAAPRRRARLLSGRRGTGGSSRLFRKEKVFYGDGRNRELLVSATLYFF